MDQTGGRTQRSHRWASFARLVVVGGLGLGCREPRPPAPPADGSAVGARAPVDAGPPAPPPRDAEVDAAGPPPGWSDVAAEIPDAVLDLRYATAHNLTGAPLYPSARCWLRASAAQRLVRAAVTLRRDGLRLVMWDCYRPPSAQAALWQRVPDRRFVAQPQVDAAGRPVGGSVHSRGGAIDVSLADRDGVPVAMPTDHDDFSAAASGARAVGAARRHLASLRAALTAAGFRPIASEWWHFEAAGTATAPLEELPD